ncbi:sprT-like domain-containing protein Spartan [Pollicipes pollicipes]|uniref:sprT-like domain-containing protein Spartan n=1 Tax=Pollicipes pollicipes TaxID=41117 RepID=UPI00188594A8|nr:sprT-like domain-containing protein Spartan [Pollicipes pollicipes]
MAAMVDADYALALRLQEEEESLLERDRDRRGPVPTSIKTVLPAPGTSLVDEAYELMDPTPDIYQLFRDFDKHFFWGKLGSVELKWSPRMTSCAGVCSYQPGSGLCSVRLSRPLLTLRPRSDLVQTLLHEMIHALLFVTRCSDNRQEHGPEFHRHMHRINKIAGTKITVYHTFHDEVAHLLTHWWRCTGPCRQRRPYFGFVKRSMNRAPGRSDFWWAQHQATCGGTFEKIREPEGYGKSKKAKKEPASSAPDKLQDIRNFMGLGKVKRPTKKTDNQKPPRAPRRTKDPSRVLGAGGARPKSGAQPGPSRAPVKHGSPARPAAGGGPSRPAVGTRIGRPACVGGGTALASRSGTITDERLLAEAADELESSLEAPALELSGSLGDGGAAALSATSSTSTAYDDLPDDGAALLGAASGADYDDPLDIGAAARSPNSSASTSYDDILDGPIIICSSDDEADYDRRRHRLSDRIMEFIQDDESDDDLVHD